MCTQTKRKQLVLFTSPLVLLLVLCAWSGEAGSSCEKVINASSVGYGEVDVQSILPISEPSSRNPRSFSVWFNPLNNPPASAASPPTTTLISICGSSSCTSSVALIASQSSSQFRFRTCDGNTSDGQTYPDYMNNWHLLTVTQDFLGNSFIYVNGSYLTQLTNDTTGYGIGLISFGFDCSVSGNYFTGYMKNIQIWSRVLSPAEVLALYQGATNTSDTSLVAWWPSNTVDSTNLTDGRNQLNGTLYNITVIDNCGGTHEPPSTITLASKYELNGTETMSNVKIDMLLTSSVVGYGMIIKNSTLQITMYSDKPVITVECFQIEHSTISISLQGEVSNGDQSIPIVKYENATCSSSTDITAVVTSNSISPGCAISKSRFDGNNILFNVACSENLDLPKIIGLSIGIPVAAAVIAVLVINFTPLRMKVLPNRDRKFYKSSIRSNDPPATA